jgi:hypothetical protein
MSRRRIVTVGIAALALAVIGAGLNVARVRAFDAGVSPPEPEFGMVGVADGQTARLNLVNLAKPVGSTVPPPCRAALRILDADGNVLAERQVSVDAGRAASLDWIASFLPTTVGDVAPALRAEIRGVVAPIDGCFPTPWRATMEIFDNATGRTSTFYPPPCRLLPPDPCRDGVCASQQ